MIPRILAYAALAIAILAVSSSKPKPAADASPTVHGITPPAVIAIPAADPTPAPDASPGAGLPTTPAPTDEAGAGFSYVDCSSGVCGPARRVAGAPVRFVVQRQPVRRAWANRPRLLPRFRR